MAKRAQCMCVKRLFAVLALMTGCTNVHVNRGALAMSTVALACDWAQTRRYAAQEWPDRTSETNPLIGAKPSTGVVDSYFIGAAAITALAWYLTPDRWRSVGPLVVIGVQAQAALRNIRNGTGTVCAW